MALGDDIFDGAIGAWGQPGSTYRAEDNKAGGMEIRFAEPTNVKQFTAHCIYANQADRNSGVCNSDGARWVGTRHC
jgi:hypothetical protein